MFQKRGGREGGLRSKGLCTRKMVQKSALFTKYTCSPDGPGGGGGPYLFPIQAQGWLPDIDQKEDLLS